MGSPPPNANAATVIAKAPESVANRQLQTVRELGQGQSVIIRLMQPDLHHGALAGVPIGFKLAISA
jgi:hypothetical protein